MRDNTGRSARLRLVPANLIAEVSRCTGAHRVVVYVENLPQRALIAASKVAPLNPFGRRAHLGYASVRLSLELIERPIDCCYPQSCGDSPVFTV